MAESNTAWAILAKELSSLLDTKEPIITLFANAAAFVYDTVERLNWAGFYLLKGNTLYLGPFIGKAACTIIEVGKGVCGTSVAQRVTIVVPDVNNFPGHIACDAASRSEIVMPLILASGRIIGVLDLDSAEVDRFSEDDRIGLELLRDVIVAKLDVMILEDNALFI
jgi:L-methionine (R)-S-oxide reductase